MDDGEKLSAICCTNDVKSITVIGMVTPCCGGMENAVGRAGNSCTCVLRRCPSTERKILEKRVNIWEPVLLNGFPF